MTTMLGPLLRMAVSLGIVLALMYVAARLLGRSRGIAPARSARPRAVRMSRRSLTSALVSSVPTPKRGRRPARRRARLEVIARQPLGKAASVAVVRVADRTLLLGVTDAAVQLLGEMDAAIFDDAGVPADLAELAGVAGRADPAALESPAIAAPATGVSAASKMHPSVSVLDLLRERTVRRA